MSNSQTVNGWQAGAIIPFTYDNENWVRDFWYNEVSAKSEVLIWTASNTAAKYGDCSYYDLDSNRYFLAMIGNANTYEGALTLNVKGKGAKPIYINGNITSATNYTLPAGMYIVHYDGKGYHFSTEDKIPGIEVDSLKVGTIGSPTNPVYFEDGKPTACSGYLDNYLPLTAGENHKLTGPLGFTEGAGNYGTTVPSSGFDGQLFFAEESETTYPVFYSDSVTLTESMNSVTIPIKIQSPCNSGNYDMLVYYNGLLLIKNTNYTASTTNISLTSWTAKSGDTFTFLALLNNTKALSITSNNDSGSNSTISGVTISANNAGNLAISITNKNGTSVSNTSEDKPLYLNVNGTKVYNQGSIEFYTKAQVDSKTTKYISSVDSNDFSVINGELNLNDSGSYVKKDSEGNLNAITSIIKIFNTNNETLEEPFRIIDCSPASESLEPGKCYIREVGTGFVVSTDPQRHCFIADEVPPIVSGDMRSCIQVGETSINRGIIITGEVWAYCGFVDSSMIGYPVMVDGGNPGSLIVKDSASSGITVGYITMIDTTRSDGRYALIKVV